MDEHNFVTWDDLFNADSFQDIEFKKTVKLNHAAKFYEYEMNRESK
jgi:hypothetical protein